MVLRSLRNRLALFFAAIVLGAIAIVYFSIVPQLEGRLRDQKLDGLAEASAQYSQPIGRVLGTRALQDVVDEAVRTAAASASAEIVVLGVTEGSKTGLFPYSDSTPDGGVELEDVQGVASQAVITGRVTRGTEPTRLGRQAMVARPLQGRGGGRYVAVFSDSLADVQDNVALIRRQILVSGAIALVLAVLAGYLVAAGLGRRVERLEQAARRVASGDFSHPIRADSDDELGRLAGTFDAMQRQLARLDSARKRFIAHASHELRTPIFSLGGFLELLEDEELSEAERRQFLAQIRGQVDRMQNLSTELLDLSRLESGALELRTEPTDLGELAREVAAEFTPAAQRHDSELEVRLSSDPIEIECDPERVAQVIRILLDNALAHTPAGTAIEVCTARENGKVRLEVTDRGLGIKRQTLPQIFEPFFTSSESAQGAGLGLAIARELAERMNGELAVRSVPGHTTFALVLPT
jgi:two-component system, OmpR family, sensor kinase